LRTRFALAGTDAMKSPAAACALVGAAFVGTYGLANQLTSVRTDVGRGVFDWERAIPFVEWTIVPYLSIVIFFAASFFVGRCRDELDRHVARLVLALALSVVCYVAFPLRFMFERPPTSGAIGLLFQLLSAVDLPYNRAPSLHIGVLVILWARFAPRLSGAWRCALHGWFATIGVSVLTTYQHHVIDVPAGLAVGALCIALTARRSRVCVALVSDGLRSRPRAIPNVGGGRMVAPAKRPVEVGQVIEPELEGNCADRAMRLERASQNAIGSRQALAEDKFRVGNTVGLEQLVQIAHGHAMAGRDDRGVQIAVMEVGNDVGLDRCEPH
jgi:hypothetical protein